MLLWGPPFFIGALAVTYPRPGFLFAPLFGKRRSISDGGRFISRTAGFVQGFFFCFIAKPQCLGQASSPMHRVAPVPGWKKRGHRQCRPCA